MAKSGMLMDTAAMEAMEAEMGPDATSSADLGGNEPAPAAKAAPEPEIEFVGPEGDKGDKPADEGKKPDKVDGKPDAKAEDAKKAAEPEGGFGQIQANLNKALREERENRRKLEAEVRERDLRHARLEERLALINAQIEKANQPQPTAADQPPDWEKDPIQAGAYWSQQVADLKRQLAEGQQQNRQQADEQARQQQYTAQITNAYRQDATAFSREHPDFKQAYDFVLAGYEREYANLPQFRRNPEAVKEWLGRYEWAIVEAALQNRESPAEAIYNLALARGYKAAEPAPTPGAQGPTEADKLAALQKAKEASDTLSGGGSPPGRVKMSLESIDRMSEKELAGFIQGLTKKGGEAAVNRMLAQMEGIG